MSNTASIMGRCPECGTDGEELWWDYADQTPWCWECHRDRAKREDQARARRDTVHDLDMWAAWDADCPCRPCDACRHRQACATDIATGRAR